MKNNCSFKKNLQYIIACKLYELRNLSLQTHVYINIIWYLTFGIILCVIKISCGFTKAKRRSSSIKNVDVVFIKNESQERDICQLGGKFFRPIHGAI